jgi:hypothetical protein
VTKSSDKMNSVAFHPKASIAASVRRRFAQDTRIDMKAAAAAALALMRFVCTCFSALFGDFRLSAYDPVMQIIPPGELYFDIVAVAILAFLSRLVILCFMAVVARGYAPLRPAPRIARIHPLCLPQPLPCPPTSPPLSPPSSFHDSSSSSSSSPYRSTPCARYAPYDSSSTALHFPQQIQVRPTRQSPQRDNI